MREEFKKCSGNEDTYEVLFPEHYFLVTCLQIGLTLQDLKMLTYVDVMKMFLSILKKEKNKTSIQKATQQDIDRFLR